MTEEEKKLKEEQQKRQAEREAEQKRQAEAERKRIEEEKYRQHQKFEEQKKSALENQRNYDKQQAQYSSDMTSMMLLWAGFYMFDEPLNRYYNILCRVDVADCDPPFKVKQKLQELGLIKMYLEAAKGKVEFCHEPQKGMSLYNYAWKLLNKMDCVNC